MIETSEQKASNILVGIRDNLLKPMTQELKQSQTDTHAVTQKQINELAEKMDQKISHLTALLQKIAENHVDFEKKLINASSEVKWNE